MSEEREAYNSKPAQFRLPKWAHEFIARESRAQNISKTDVVLRALESYERARLDAELERGYIELGDFLLQETREWDALGIDAPLPPWDEETDAQG